MPDLAQARDFDTAILHLGAIANTYFPTHYDVEIKRERERERAEAAKHASLTSWKWFPWRFYVHACMNLSDNSKEY